MWKSIRVVRLALVPAAMLILVAPTAAQAAPVQHEHYSDSDSGTSEACGLTLTFEDTFSGQFLVREVKESGGQAFFAHDNYSFRSVQTNVANGKWLVIRGKGLFKEMTATNVEGNVWEFTAMDVGQPFVLEDSSGNVVLRDRGRITFRALFDTEGDGQPGGILLAEEVTGVHGPHPGLDNDLCPIVNELLG
jgi:hypothetical protein